MSGFQHDIAGGNGNLVIQSVKSPNFVHGESGWAINKDGSAEFHDIQLPAGTGGATVYFDSTAPSSPNRGDLWYNTADGLALSQWNGSEWVGYQIGTGAIADQAITADKLVANMIIAGIVDGTEIQGADFIVTATNGGKVYVYDAAPAAGTLKVVVAAEAGSDSYGTSYPAGITVFGSTDTWNPGLSLPVNAANQGGNAFINSFIGNSGAASEYYGAQFMGAKDSAYPSQPYVAMWSASNDGSSGASGALGYYDANGNQQYSLGWDEFGHLTHNLNLTAQSGDVPRFFYAYLSGDVTVPATTTLISQFSIDPGVLGKHFLVDFNFIFLSSSATSSLLIEPSVASGSWFQGTAYRPGSGSTTFANVISAGSVGNNTLSCNVASTTSWYSALGSGVFKYATTAGGLVWYMTASTGTYTLKAGSYVRIQQLD